jgi:cytochrome c oxidase subunit III
MASFTPSIPVKEPQARRGGGANVPQFPGGDGDGRGGGDNSPDYGERLRRYRLGLAVGIAPIVMLFVAFTSAYMVRQGLPQWNSTVNAYVADWVPVSVPVALLTVNTLILLLSSVSMEMARRQSIRRLALAPVVSMPGIASDEHREVPWLTITVIMGMGFLVGQYLAWRELAARGFYVASSPSSSFVYLLTGAHAVHLLGGVLALLYAASTQWLRKPLEVRRIVVDVAGWYWHFMAVLWLYVFALVLFA